MSDDFDDGDSDSFFSGADDGSKVERALGLFVPPRARLIFDAKGALIYDENAANELAFRKRGMPRITFDEGDPDDSPDAGSVY